MILLGQLVRLAPCRHQAVEEFEIGLFQEGEKGLIDTDHTVTNIEVREFQPKAEGKRALHQCFKSTLSTV